MADQKNDVTIQRAPHSNNYFSMNRQSAQDKKLSWGATGLLAYILSLPSNWIIRPRELSNHKLNGRDATLKLLKELIDNQYIYIQEYKENNLKRIRYFLFEVPYNQKDIEHLRLPENQALESPSLENPSLLNIHKESTDIKNTYNKRKRASDEKFLDIRDNVKLTEKQMEILKTKNSEEDLKLIFDKLSRYKRIYSQEYASDFKAINKWVIGAVRNEKNKAKAINDIKHKNILVIKEIQEALERKQKRGLLKFSENEAIDEVLGKSCNLDNPGLPKFVASWYGWEWED